MTDPVPANMAPRVVDVAVTNIRINPKGIFEGSTGTGDPSARLTLKAIVQ